MWCLILPALLLLGGGVPSLAATYTVEPDGTGDFPTIQAAVNAASDGDVIVLTNGVFTGDGNRDLDFLGKTIAVRSQHDNPPDCVIDCQASESDPHRGVVFHSGETALSLIRGLTIRNACATGSYPASTGGAVYCRDASPSITNCVFLRNSASSGGGVTCHSSRAILTDCTFNGNTARLYGPGGGLYCYDASPSLVNCTFDGNSRNGLYWHAGSSPTVIGGVFINHPEWGLRGDSGSAIIQDCRFSWNGDRGVQGQTSSPTITRCVFDHNRGAFGGGIYCGEAFSARIQNCIFVSNTADQAGGAAYCGNGSPLFVNCTMASNGASLGAGGIYASGSLPVLQNVIIAFGTAGQALQGSARLSCCDIYGNAGGDWIGNIANQYGVDGNTSADPEFCDLEGSDLHLQEGSPCAPGQECELIGALPVACGPPVPVQIVSWGTLKALFRE
jgi:predicted outer membrane repeat protein